MALNPDQIAKLPPGLRKAAELEQKATPGPWDFDPDLEYFFTRHPDLYQIAPTYGQVLKCPETETPSIEDAEFIREARTALPLALAWGLQVVEERDAAKEELTESTLEISRLTPGGSEFAGDWRRCIAWIREKRGSLHKTMISAIKQKRTAEATIATLTRERDEALALVDKAIAANDVIIKRLAALSHPPEGGGQS